MSRRRNSKAESLTGHSTSIAMNDGFIELEGYADDASPKYRVAQAKSTLRLTGSGHSAGPLCSTAQPSDIFCESKQIVVLEFGNSQMNAA